MAFQLPELPYAKDALAPHISAETLEFHWGKHHRTYVTKTNDMIADKANLSGASLVDVIRAARDNDDKKLFNNSAQLWNHSFFWQCLSPEQQQPSGRLAQLINDDFGGVEPMLQKLGDEAVNHFSNGWCSTATSSRSPRFTMPTRRWCTRAWFRSSRWMCGSTLITSITATSVRAS